MPIEYVRRIPREQYGYEEFKLIGEDPHEMAEQLLALDKLIEERPTAFQVFTGSPNNNTADGYEYEDQENIPFDDVPHPADDSSAQFDKLKQRRQQANKPKGVNCGVCGGPTWDNRESKKNPRQPDYKCRDKDCNAAMWLTDEGEHGQWKQ